MIGCFFYSSSINVTIVLKKVTRTSNLYGIRLGFRTVYNIKFSTDIFIIVVVQSLSRGLQHARLPCASPPPGACSDSHPLS